jgi:hypothetical protein
MAEASTTKKTAAKKAAPKQETDKPQETQAQRESRLKRQAYSNAESRLREAHGDEFRQYVAEEAKQLGVVYEFRKTKAERAAEQVEALIAEHPELLEKFKPQTVSDLAPADRPLSYSGDEPLADDGTVAVDEG